MGTPYIGEVRMFGGNFAPAGWAFCDGQLIAISENEALFNLIGTTYGGDGQNTFALPDLRGRIPIHMGQGPGLSNRILSESAGAVEVTLTQSQIPSHNHEPMRASAAATTANDPQGRVPGNSPSVDLWIEDAPTANLAPQAIGSRGGSQPHENQMPYLCVNYIISLFGIFPSPT
jgi:microcystin-dependent protein